MSSGGPSDDETPRPPARPVRRRDDGGDGPPRDPGCDLVEPTVLNSPDRNVVATVRVGDALPVRYDHGPPKRLLVQALSGAVVGSLTPPSLAQLISCIEAGASYEAVVLAIRGGRVEVQVQIR